MSLGLPSPNTFFSYMCKLINRFNLHHSIFQSSLEFVGRRRGKLLCEGSSHLGGNNTSVASSCSSVFIHWFLLSLPNKFSNQAEYFSIHPSHRVRSSKLHHSVEQSTRGHEIQIFPWHSHLSLEKQVCIRTVAFQYYLTNLSATAFGGMQCKFEPFLTASQSVRMLMQQLFLTSKYLMYTFIFYYTI